MMYLVWSNEHNAWWKPNGRGYTMFAAKAGLYSFGEAKSICWKGRDGWREDGKVPDEVLVPIEGIPEEFRPSLNGEGNQSDD